MTQQEIQIFISDSENVENDISFFNWKTHLEDKIYNTDRKSLQTQYENECEEIEIAINLWELVGTKPNGIKSLSPENTMKLSRLVTFLKTRQNEV